MTIKLNKEIYPKKSVLKAVNAYKKIVNFNLKIKNKYFLISGKTEEKNRELIKDEFLNFILGIIK